MMSPHILALKSLRHRKLTLVLSVASIALSVILLLGVERIRRQVHESFSSTISGTDLIVGSRTGSVSLLLSSVFHIGFPNQNIQYETYEEISENPRVAWTIPFSLGDSHRGFPVLGTTRDYFDHFQYGRKQNLEAAAGTPDIQEMGAVLGSRAARELEYLVGDQVIVTHGMGEESFVEHSDEPFVVTAILKPTGTPVDHTVHVSLFAMDQIHAAFEEHYHEMDPLEEALIGHDHGSHEPEQLTGFMLGMKNRADVLMFQRALNTYEDEPLTAIMPVLTLLELWSVVRPVEKALLLISILVLFVAFTGMLTTLMTSLNERRREMAILRSVGARPKHIFRLVVLEAMGVTLSGIVAGFLVLQGLLLIARPLLSARLGIVIGMQGLSGVELLMLGLILLGGTLIGTWPAYRSYRHSLADGLMVKV